MNNYVQLQRFIQKKPYLVWHTKPEDVSEEAIVEAVLNYADFDDIKKIIKILGIKKVAKSTDECLARQFSRAVKGYGEQGAEGLTERNRRRVSVNCGARGE